MAFLAAEVGVQECMNQFAGELAAYDAAPEHQHVHVIMFHALVRRVCVMAKPGANAWKSVGRHGRSDAAAAEDDAALGPALAQGFADGGGVIGIVHRVLAVGPHVQGLVMLRRQEAFHRFLQFESCMICTNCDSHHSPRLFDLLPGCNQNALGHEAEFLLQLLQRCRRTERVQANAVTTASDVARPTQGGRLLDRHAGGD